MAATNRTSRVSVSPSRKFPSLRLPHLPSSAAPAGKTGRSQPRTADTVRPRRLYRLVGPAPAFHRFPRRSSPRLSSVAPLVDTQASAGIFHMRYNPPDLDALSLTDSTPPMHRP